MEARPRLQRCVNIRDKCDKVLAQVQLKTSKNNPRREIALDAEQQTIFASPLNI